MLKIIEVLFSISGLLFILSVLIHKTYISKQKDTMKASNFIAAMAVFLAFYILLGIIGAFLIPSYINKIIMLIFALSPFIIGKFATYEHEKTYSLIQVFCVLISVAFVLIKG